MVQLKKSEFIRNGMDEIGITTAMLADAMGICLSGVYTKLMNNSFSKPEWMYTNYLLNSGRKLSKCVLTPEECQSLKKQAKMHKFRLADLADELQITPQSVSARFRTGKFKVSELYYLKYILKFKI